MRPREQRLRLWLREQELTLAGLAKRMEVHKSAPGKWLISYRAPLPEARRVKLLTMGMPSNMLP